MLSKALLKCVQALKWESKHVELFGSLNVQSHHLDKLFLVDERFLKTHTKKLIFYFIIRKFR